MPVPIDAFSVIIKAAAIAARYQGGWQRFHSDVPNSTFCSDGELAHAAFMAAPDFINYIELLQARGLQPPDGDRAVDFVVVKEPDELLYECDWLELLEAEVDDGRVITVCRLAGSDSEEVVFPETGSKRPAEFVYLSPEETSARMRFLRHENGVDVFEDVRTGKEWFVGRTSPGEPVEDQLNDPSHLPSSGMKRPYRRVSAGARHRMASRHRRSRSHGHAQGPRKKL